MAIDDHPLKVARGLVTAEESGDTPARRLTAKLAKHLPFPGKLAAEILGKSAEENISYLVDLLVTEVIKVSETVDTLGAKSEAHAKFHNAEWPLLFEGGVRRAILIRSQKRLARIGAILTHSLIEDPPPQPDDIEEMMRIAAELGDRDSFALKIIFTEIGARTASDKRLGYQTAYDLWKSIKWIRHSFTEPEIDSIASKLSGLGLLARLDRHPTQNALSPEYNGYELL